MIKILREIADEQKDSDSVINDVLVTWDAGGGNTHVDRGFITVEAENDTLVLHPAIYTLQPDDVPRTTRWPEHLVSRNAHYAGHAETPKYIRLSRVTAVEWVTSGYTR